MHLRAAMLSFAFSGLLVLACGSESEPDDGKGSSGGEGSSGFGNGDDPNGSSGTPQSSGGPSCAAQEAAAARKPVKLLIVLDQSRSMGQGNNNARWVPVTTALKAFLADERSRGIDASMRLFPLANGNNTQKCEAASYTTPNVPMTPLPDTTTFASRLVANPDFANTPTRAVLKAAVADAKTVAAASPDAKVAIVLITDGAPFGCDSADNDINNVASEVAGTKATIPTYVIGVGSIDNLNTIAITGGPRNAFVVSVNDPAATQAELLAAVDEIRGATIACDVEIPAPPAGQTLDPNKVNVNYTPTGKPVQQLQYDEACAGEGWRYDDKANPKQVILCPGTCTLAKADPSAKLAIEFGCVTRGRDVQ